MSTIRICQTVIGARTPFIPRFLSGLLLVVCFIAFEQASAEPVRFTIQSTSGIPATFVTPSEQSFEILTEHSVLDRVSRLVWLRRDDQQLRHWKEAMQWCQNLNLDGRNWRLPERAELLSLVDYNKSDPAIDLYFFPETKSFNYWAATPYTGTPSHAWSVLFSEGNAYCFTRELQNYTRCVSDYVDK